MQSGISPQLKEFLEALQQEGLNTYYQANLGKGKYKPVFTPTPSPLTLPHKWDYERAKTKLYQLSELLSPEESERVNVQFENPGLREYIPAATTSTMRAGIQLLKPGWKAPSHRHTANAIRFVLEAKEGGYTIVDGVKIPMKPGDLIITPNWLWHEHGNEGVFDVIWLDVLDVIFTYWIGAVFYTTLPERWQGVRNDASLNQAHFGRGVSPTAEVPGGRLLYYPFKDAEAALQAQGRREWSVVRYINPRIGGDATDTMAFRMVMVKEGGVTPNFRRTENLILNVFMGVGRVVLPERKVEFKVRPHDVVAIPSWEPYYLSNEGKESLYVFVASDEPLFRAAGFFREEKGGEGGEKS